MESSGQEGQIVNNPQPHNDHEKLIFTDMYNIRNVDLTQTHDLIRCSCGFFGWFKKEAWA